MSETFPVQFGAGNVVDEAATDQGSLGRGDALTSYLRVLAVREPAVLRRLRKETAALDEGAMQIGPTPGQFDVTCSNQGALIAANLILADVERCLVQREGE